MTNPNAIGCISVYGVEIPDAAIGSRWFRRDRPQHLDSTIVMVETEDGLSGIGESCPVGAIYLPAYSAGLRAALAEIAPALIGVDATQINRVNRVMDQTLFGHGYAKAAIDIACWDLLGQHCGQPVSALLGGRFQSRIPLYAVIPSGEAEAMVATLQQKQAEGYTRFQVKLGEDPLVDVQRLRAVVAAGRLGDLFMADANRGWSQADALRAIDAINELDCYVEQPCETYAECRHLRQHCTRPVLLDEVIDDVDDLVRAIGDDALDALVIKLTHAGGLSRARALRDLCAAHGLRLRIEDTAGSEIARAAQAQLAAATPLQLQLGCYGFVNQRPPVADDAPEVRDGMLYLNDRPGLGVTPKLAALGIPLAVYA